MSPIPSINAPSYTQQYTLSPQLSLIEPRTITSANKKQNQAPPYFAMPTCAEPHCTIFCSRPADREGKAGTWLKAGEEMDRGVCAPQPIHCWHCSIAHRTRTATHKPGVLCSTYSEVRRSVGSRITKVRMQTRIPHFTVESYDERKP